MSHVTRIAHKKMNYLFNNTNVKRKKVAITAMTFKLKQHKV